MCFQKVLSEAGKTNRTALSGQSVSGIMCWTWSLTVEPLNLILN